MSINDGKSIIRSWLQSQHRTLTAAQNNIVVKAFNKCPLALYLKLSLDEACQWKSFTPPDQTVLQKTVRASIVHLFQRLEIRYGNLFVSRTLGYLTAGKNWESKPPCSACSSILETACTFYLSDTSISFIQKKKIKRSLRLIQYG